MNKATKRKFNRQLKKAGIKQDAVTLERQGLAIENKRQELLQLGREGAKVLKDMANMHLGNKLTKPHGYWNPQGKTVCMSRLKSGKAMIK